MSAWHTAFLSLPAILCHTSLWVLGAGLEQKFAKEEKEERKRGMYKVTLPGLYLARPAVADIWSHTSY